MTVPHDPTSAPQASPPAGVESIPLAPLPPPRKQAGPEALAAEMRRLDIVLGALVLALAFLLASFTVRNTDFWQHLAAGRLVARGNYHFGTDPFSYASSGYWANHAWFYDLFLYAFTSLAGGPESAVGGALVVGLKAALIMLLAWLMLQMRRKDQGLWAPVICTMVALLAMSPGFALQPSVLSLLFLGLTLYLLQRPVANDQPVPRRGTAARSKLHPYWLLPPLFVLWVNVDGWFLLGPLVVTLYLLGQLLQRAIAPIRTGPEAPDPRQPVLLLTVLLVGLAACFLNPHHYHAFTLPALLSWSTPLDAYQNDLLFRPLLYSPLSEDYYRSPVGANVAALAYIPLLVGGLVSFVLSYFHGWRWWRAIVWVGFAALTITNARLVPFFAVVAGPITALNLQDFARGRFGALPRTEGHWKAWSLGGRIATICLGLVLLLAAWPGWLHGTPTDVRQYHRVDWSVEADPSLKQSALALAKWRQEGALRESAQGFNYIPHIENYCAWFCADPQTGLPLEKGFLDYRFELFPDAVVREYIDVRQALFLNPNRPVNSLGKSIKWQEIFRKHHIEHVILNSNDFTAQRAREMLTQDWEHWKLVYLDGRTSVFLWRDSRSNAATADWDHLPRFDPNVLAFRPSTETAPEEGGRSAEPQDLWTRYLVGPPAQPLAADRAAQYLEYYRSVAGHWLAPYLAAVEVSSWGTGVGQAAGGPGGALAFGTANQMSIFQTRNILQQLATAEGSTQGRETGPPAAPILAVRAAREAIAISPDDPRPYDSLAKAYSMLWRLVEDRWSGREFDPRFALTKRQRIRQVQLTTALESLVRLRPNDEQAHLMLLELYRDLNFKDLALEQFREVLRIAEAAGPHPGEAADEFKKRIETNHKVFDDNEKNVANRLNKWEIDSVEKPLFTQAAMAIQQGLGGKARDLLLINAGTALDPRTDVKLLFDLLLQTGRPDQVRLALSADLRAPFGAANYEWFMIQLSAASGDYKEAGKYLDETIDRYQSAETMTALAVLQQQTFNGVTIEGLQGLGTVTELARNLAEFRTLRGMLALEEGDPATAAKFFEKALATGDRKEFGFECRSVAERYLELIRQQAGR